MPMQWRVHRPTFTQDWHQFAVPVDKRTSAMPKGRITGCGDHDCASGVVPCQQFRLSLDSQAPAAASISARPLRQYQPGPVLARDGDDRFGAFWSTGLAVDECVAWNWNRLEKGSGPPRLVASCSPPRSDEGVGYSLSARLVSHRDPDWSANRHRLPAGRPNLDQPPLRPEDLPPRRGRTSAADPGDRRSGGPDTHNPEVTGLNPVPYNEAPSSWRPSLMPSQTLCTLTAIQARDRTWACAQCPGRVKRLVISA